MSQSVSWRTMNIRSTGTPHASQIEEWPDITLFDWENEGCTDVTVPFDENIGKKITKYRDLALELKEIYTITFDCIKISNIEIEPIYQGDIYGY
ncbi:hypothetical protein HHI36_013678, partial [Cryptolaemus montrouzieri]